MKKLYILAFTLIASLSFAQNLVVNPTFENGLTSWTSTGSSSYALPTHVTNDGQDDSFSVQYVATGTTGFDQRFTVVPGATVSVSFWYKAARTNGATTGNTARIWSVFSDPTSGTTTPINPPGTTGASDDPLRNNNNFLAQASTWTQVTITSEVPAGATVFQLQFRAYNGATVSFDNISFSSPGASVLSSSSFNLIKDLKVFVNNNNLFVTSNSTDDKQVNVYNMQGKEVVNTITSGSGINVSDLASGIYIVKVTENGISETRKIAIK